MSGGLTFGRRSKPESHRLYYTDLCNTEQRAVIKYSEPKALARDDTEPATFVELRIGAGDKGAQTVFPGSVHPCGERVRWDREGEPKKVDGAFLKHCVAALAVAVLLVRNYPKQSTRHEAALVIGGVLARMPGIDKEDVEHFVEAVARVAGDEEAVERGRSAAGAIDLLAQGKPTPGLPRMSEVWGEDVANTVAKWLNLGRTKSKNDDTGQTKTNQADILIELAAAAELFHTDDSKGYADIPVNGHRETWWIASKGFREWLLHRYYTKVGGAPTSEALRTAIEQVSARARFDAPMRRVCVRIGGHEGKLYLDLADDAWRAVEIDAKAWRVVDKPPVRFRRVKGMLPLPVPVKGGSIETLRSFINVKREPDFVLLVTWLLAALRDCGPYPILKVWGEPGSAKSTLVDILRALIDPNKASRRRFPREDRDLFIAWLPIGICVCSGESPRITVWSAVRANVGRTQARTSRMSVGGRVWPGAPVFVLSRADDVVPLPRNQVILAGARYQATLERTADHADQKANGGWVQGPRAVSDRVRAGKPVRSALAAERR